MQTFQKNNLVKIMAKNKKNFNPDVSVIIAMYNAEKYIEECLRSLLNQTFKNFEVIVIDDCSTDNSVNVVKKMTSDFETKEEGSRLILLKMKKNSGCAGIPRNSAIKSARGKYIYFLDSDDFIEKTAFEDLYKVAEEYSADVVHCEKYFQYTEKDGETKDKIFTWQFGNAVEKITLETDNIVERVQKFTEKKFLWWGCNKFLRRKFLIENKIQYPDTTSFEDMVFMFCCVTSAKNYVRVPFVHYHYRIRSDSLSHRVVDVDRFMDNMLGNIRSLSNFMQTQKNFTENPALIYKSLDFFAQERLDVFSSNILQRDKQDLGKIFVWLWQKIFSQKPSENVVFTSYLFVLTNILRYNLQQQSKQIKELQEKLKEKEQEENFN